MGNVGGSEGTREVLRAQETQTLTDWENLGLRVQVPRGGPFVAAGSDPKSSVLDYLKLFAGICTRIWEPNWGCVGEDGPYQCFVCHDYGFLLLTPVCARECFQDFEFSCGPVD